MFTIVPDKGVGDTFTDEMWDMFIKDNMNMGLPRPIAETILSSGAATIDFSSIPADWMHLVVVICGRTDGAVLASGVNTRFNNDSSAIYDQQLIFSDNATALSVSEALAQTSATGGLLTGSTATANRFGYSFQIIPHYMNTAHHKNIFAYCGLFEGTAANSGRVRALFNTWRSTSAINRITWLPATGSWIAGSALTLYGWGEL